MASRSQVEESVRQSHEIVQQGRWMQEFKDSVHYERFKTLIIDELDREAYNNFCSVLNPDEKDKIFIFQVMGQVARQVMDRIDTKIQLGRLSAEQLNSTLKEDETNE